MSKVKFVLKLWRKNMKCEAFGVLMLAGRVAPSPGKTAKITPPEATDSQI